MQVPKIEKIVVNMGVGDAIHNPKLLDAAVEELTQIVGQKPVITPAQKNPLLDLNYVLVLAIGCKATLRGERMYEFYDKLVTIAIPRLRDFRGLSKDAFDGRGNYTIGIKEQLIFPEVNYDKVFKN